MGIDVHWLDRHQTIIQLKFSDTWTLVDLTNAFERVFAMMELVHHPVHYLLDMSDSLTMPFDNVFDELKRIAKMHHPVKDEYMAIVTHSKIHLTLVRKLQTFHPEILPKYIQVFAHTGQAVQWLNAVNRNLMMQIRV